MISSCCSCAYVKILSTWEVWRALKRLELHSSAPLSCSPNFPCAQYLDICMLTHHLTDKTYYLSICWHADEGCESKTKDSVYNTHLNFQSFFSEKKCALYTVKYGNAQWSSLKKVASGDYYPGSYEKWWIQYLGKMKVLPSYMMVVVWCHNMILTKF